MDSSTENVKNAHSVMSNYVNLYSTTMLEGSSSPFIWSTVQEFYNSRGMFTFKVKGTISLAKVITRPAQEVNEAIMLADTSSTSMPCSSVNMSEIISMASRYIEPTVNYELRNLKLVSKKEVGTKTDSYYETSYKVDNTIHAIFSSAIMDACANKRLVHYSTEDNEVTDHARYEIGFNPADYESKMQKLYPVQSLKMMLDAGSQIEDMVETDSNFLTMHSTGVNYPPYAIEESSVKLIHEELTRTGNYFSSVAIGKIKLNNSEASNLNGLDKMLSERLNKALTSIVQTTIHDYHFSVPKLKPILTLTNDISKYEVKPDKAPFSKRASSFGDFIKVTEMLNENSLLALSPSVFSPFVDINYDFNREAEKLRELLLNKTVYALPGVFNVIDELVTSILVLADSHYIVKAGYRSTASLKTYDIMVKNASTVEYNSYDFVGRLYRLMRLAAMGEVDQVSKALSEDKFAPLLQQAYAELRFASVFVGDGSSLMQSTSNNSQMNRLFRNFTYSFFESISKAKINNESSSLITAFVYKELHRRCMNLFNTYVNEINN